MFDAISNLYIDIYKSSYLVYVIAWNIDRHSELKGFVLASRRKCLSQLEVDNEVPTSVRLTWYWARNKCPLSVLRDVHIKRVSFNRGLTVYFTITEQILRSWLVESYHLWEYRPWKWCNMSHRKLKIIVIVKNKSTTIFHGLHSFSKIQLVVCCQCCILTGWATTRLYLTAH